jgi:class 3 adenylate cyclase
MRRLLERRTDWEPRFLEGTGRELEELFGGRLPQLPGREPAFLVDLHPGLRKTLRDLLESIGQSLTAKTPGARPPGADEAFGRFEEALETLLTTIIERERRLGLFNLFWLAHSRDVAELIQELSGRPGVPAGLKYRIHPLVQGSYRNALARLWARARSRPDLLVQRHLGADYNPSLLDAVVDDQLPLIEPSAAQLNFAQVLVEANRRFRLTFAEFREVFNLARERLREARERREARLLELLRRTLPGLKPEQMEDERVLPRVLFSARILAALLAGAPAAERPSARGGKLRPWGEVVADFLDFTQAVKRFEVLDALRREVRLVGPREGGDARAAYDAGRLYRFHPGAEVVTLAWKITILFADLRGFTRASEGSVSERELTDHLYGVFDPLAAIVERHQGRIDKFTGDGVMITFGFDGAGPHDEENALRTALAIQALMAQLRAERRTHFEMGISVHTGRAQVAHFILDREAMDRTVIGRNVNIAGRLSGSGKTQASAFDDAGAAPAEAEVTVDEDGTLYNTGIVVSQDTVEALLTRVDAEAWQDGPRRGFRFADAELGKKVLLEYVGDAKFKGVGRAIAIYRLGLGEARSVGASRGTAQ